MSIEEKTLVDVLRDIWRAKVYVAVLGAAGLVLAGLWMVASTPYYRANMIISPASPMNGAEVSSLLANDNLFALRYLVQRVGVANSSDFLRFESIYNGPSVAAVLLKDPNIEKGLNMDRAFVFSRRQSEWRPELLAEYVTDNVALEPVGNTSLRRLVYHHPNRKFATYFLGRLHGISDALIRKTIREETEGRITYLKGSVQKTSNPEHRRALTSLLLEQERLRMLVSIDQPYAAAVVEPPSGRVKPSWPDPYFLFSVFAFAGAVAGFVVFSIREELTKSKRIKAAVSTRRRSWIKSGRAGSNENVIISSSSHAAE